MAFAINEKAADLWKSRGLEGVSIREFAVLVKRGNRHLIYPNAGET
ncbi:MAG: hypothetical protein Q8909_14695 [Bacteroidota bacterium]|nr:hypothetical protein [Bacteroidota bacterium]